MRRRRLTTALALAGPLILAPAVSLAVAPARAAAPQSRIITSGNARFEIISPTLIRMEYSPTASFEDRPTETALARQDLLATPAPAYTLTDNGITLTVNTGKLTMTYVEKAPLAGGLTFTLDVGGTSTTALPTWDPCEQAPTACGPSDGAPGTVGTDTSLIGGYIREAITEPVDGMDTRQPEHGGVLTTKGYYTLDDTTTALRPDGGVGQPAAVARAMTPGYLDGYFFGYGQNYAQALQDLNALTGPTPILPEWMYGPWFSNYQAYTASDYEDTIIPAFRGHQTPVDGLVVDTNWKRPDQWNGWGFGTAPDTLFPDPKAFFTTYAQAQGLHTVLNIHPSIDGSDPNFAETQAAAGGTLATGQLNCEFYQTNLPSKPTVQNPVPVVSPGAPLVPPCYTFDWSDPKQTAAYFKLHDPIDAAGVSLFWLDWCCDASTVSNTGLTPDSWINDLYAARKVSQGGRSVMMGEAGSGIYSYNDVSGIADAPATGAWAAHRSTIPVTGDAESDFSTLAYEAALAPAEGAAIDESYLSPDVGGYTVQHLSDDLYARWVQMGAFLGIDRLHGKHSDRMPWQYADGSGADISAERFLRLREALVPYSYTAGAQAHDTGLPVLREMAVAYPGSTPALAATDEWMYGDSMLVAPILTAGASTSRSVWIPPGQWWDFFTGQSVTGPSTITTPAEGFDRMPVYVKAGGIIPMAPYMDHVGQKAEDPLTLRVGPGAPGTSSLYEDSGDGNAYLNGQRASTPLSYTEPSAAGGRVVIGARTGAFAGAATSRAYAVQFLSIARPANVTVDGVLVRATNDTTDDDQTDTVSTKPSADSWSYDPDTRVATVLIASRPTNSDVVVYHDVPTAQLAPAALPEATDPVLLLLPGLLAVGLAITVTRRRRRA